MSITKFPISERISYIHTHQEYFPDCVFLHVHGAEVHKHHFIVHKSITWKELETRIAHCNNISHTVDMCVRDCADARIQKQCAISAVYASYKSGDGMLYCILHKL